MAFGFVMCLALAFVVHVALARLLGLRGLSFMDLGKPSPSPSSPSSSSSSSSSPSVSPARPIALGAAGPVLVYALTSALLFAYGNHAFDPGPRVARVSVVPGMPAAAAGVVDGDLIVAVDGAPIETFDDARRALESAHAERRAPPRVLTVERAGADGTLAILVVPDERGRIGVRNDGEPVARSPWSTLASAATAPLRAFALSVSTLFGIASGAIDPDSTRVDVLGPVAIYDGATKPSANTIVMLALGLHLAAGWPWLALFALVTTTIALVRRRRAR